MAVYGNVIGRWFVLFAVWWYRITNETWSVLGVEYYLIELYLWLMNSDLI
jgi:hypothetical protein